MSNFLAEATESSGEYHPTEGVRILEFESEGEDPQKGTPFRAEVELWDCSGSRRFAIYNNYGIISLVPSIMYNIVLKQFSRKKFCHFA